MTTTLRQYQLHLFVPGTPAPQGSKRHLGRGIMIESSKNVGPWRERIALAAHNYATIINKDIPLPFHDQPLEVVLKFVMPRPAATPKTRRTPPAVKRPDLDKLCRCVLDALTGIIYADDAAVTHIDVHKRLAEPNETPGVHISVENLP
jgi:crossover junction endodeoxyribonuclease RusA